MAKNVFAVIDEIRKGLEELQEALSPFAAFAKKETPRAARRVGRIVRKRGRRVVKKAVPVATRQLRVLQGKYMSLVRSLSKTQKEQVRKIRASKGYKDAMRLAENFARRK